MGRIWQSSPQGEKFPLNRVWSRSRDPFKNLTPPPFNISGMDEDTLFKFGKWIDWIDYGKSHVGVKKFPRKGRGLDHVTLFKILNSLQYFWNG